MSSGVFRKLARARTVCTGAGFLLTKLRAQYGDDFGEGMRQQVDKAINDCHAQGQALLAQGAKDAKQAERMHEQRARNIANNQPKKKGERSEEA